MKRSVSNIAWQQQEDQAAYGLMEQYGYSGLEIAPTRIWRENPYERTVEAGAWAKELNKRYGFTIPSMQSIWFGRKEKIFGTLEERQILLAYTKKAIDFAAAVGCNNLVFGCPRNRFLPEGADSESAVLFFKEIGDYAAAHGTVIGMEANPPIYHTNYITDTLAAMELIRQVGSNGFLLNLDVGTMICNGEKADEIQGKVHYINHVHISEPGLGMIQERVLHRQLNEILNAERYRGYISIEMGKVDNMDKVKWALEYVGRIFSNE